MDPRDQVLYGFYIRRGKKEKGYLILLGNLRIRKKRAGIVVD